MRIKLLTAAAATALLAASTAMAQTAPQTPPAEATPQTQPAEAAADAATAQATPAAANNVIDVLKSNGQFSTLLTALDQAQLTETLATHSAVTVFAPTDAAFAALPEADRTRLMDPANAQELRNLLLYHVIAAELTTDQIQGAAGPVPSAGGAELQIDGSGDGIKVGTAMAAAELDASNGGVFPIDKVLNPSDTAQGDAEAAPAAPAAPATETTQPATGVNAPNGEPAAAVTTTASPPVENPTDGQVDEQEDPANPAPTPN